MLRKPHGDLCEFCLNEFIMPQSSNAEKLIDSGSTTNDVILNNIVCDSAKTTCFVEDESLVKTSLKLSPIENDYEIKYETIKDFLGKPYLLTSFLWGTGTAENGNLYFNDIGPNLVTVTPWADKIRGFELIRGTFNLRVQINASPFQSGKILVHYLPNYRDRVAKDPLFAARYNSHMIQKYQHPHILLDCRDTVAIFSVPYISPSPFYDVKSATFDWGRIFLDVASPLAIGAGASVGTTTAEVTVFGYWDNIELAAPINPQSNNKEKFVARKGVDLEEKEHAIGPITHGLRAVSSAASTLSSIPFLSPVMTTVSWAADVGSQIASVFGWSKPRSNDAVMVVARQPMRYTGTSDGPDTSLPISLISTNAIETTDDYTITSQDEMSLKFLLSVPTYTDRVSWTTSQTSGFPLLSQSIRPQLLREQINSTTGVFTHTARYGAPLYYLSNFFALWRGSMTLNIKIAKTMYHSGKLLITFTPIETPIVSPGVTDSIYNLREIIDIRQQSEITLTLPYMLHRHYLDANQSMGTINVYVLNDLRCPETVAQQVDLLFFWKAGEDFEFQAPVPVTEVGAGTFTPQSDSAETIVNSGIAESAIKPCSTKYSSRSIGEHFLSIKQFLNRNSQLQTLAAVTYASTSVTLNPWHITGLTNVPVVGTLRTSTFGADAFSYLAPMYNYYRGKARVILTSETPNNINGFNNTNYLKNVSALGEIVTGSSTYGINTNVSVLSDLDRNSFNTPVPSGAYHGYQFIHVPYYSKYPVSFTQVWNGSTINFYTDETQPISNATFTSSSNFGATTVLQRSFCDDFQLMFFIGCPGLYLSSS